MDLRQKKTLRAIEQAFYSLRKQKKLGAITVTELCKNAEISKATFYLHYRDIFDLSEKLQNDVIDSVFVRLENPMEILTNPSHYMEVFLWSMEQDQGRIQVVFADSQLGVLPIRILQHLKKYIFNNLPELHEDPQIQTFLTYHIMGSYYACMENNGIDYKETLKILETIQLSLPIQ